MKHLKVLALVAAMAVVAKTALAQGAAAGGVQPSRVLITTKDSTAAARTQRMILVQAPIIDSLVKRLENLPVGSPEYLATDSALTLAASQLMPAGGGTFRLEITAPRAAMRTPTDMVPQGTLGFTADGVNRVWYAPTGTYLQYFQYPTVIRIETNSPASRAGVRAGDTLMAYNGLDVRHNPLNMTQLLTPGREVAVRLRRDGEAKDVLMTVEKASAALIADRRVDAVRATMPDAPIALEERAMVERRASTMARATAPGVAPRAVVGGAMVEVPGSPIALVPARRGVLGAAMTDVDQDLANSLRGMKGKRGVLVTMVPQGSLADRTGLKSGDVILRVDASDVASVSALSQRLFYAESNGAEKVKLMVLRGGKTQDIYYTTR